MKSLTILIFAVATFHMVTARYTFKTKLRIVRDVTLERGSVNYNSLKYLIVGTHPGFPLKRSLLRFEPLQGRGCNAILDAKMYLYYAYAHKASYMSEKQVPSFPARTIVAHQMLKWWSESQATSTKRYNGVNWSQPWLNLGSDARLAPTSNGVTINPDVTPSGFYPIDVTSAVRNWSRQPNYGLLIRATNEYRQGRDFCFKSNADPTTNHHAYIVVTCLSHKWGSGKH